MQKKNRQQLNLFIITQFDYLKQNKDYFCFHIIKILLHQDPLLIALPVDQLNLPNNSIH
jgi:hypothetical protein